MADTDRDVSELAREVIQELDPGTVIDDRVILSRRQAIGLASGALSLGALAGFGAEEASAQAAGAQGTESEPNDMFAYNLDVENGGDFNGTGITNLGALNGGGPVSDGDGIERQLWVIASGASDPSGADAEDIIFEEQS
jgi:hypothetical protein